MRVLVLGGTAWLGGEVARYAVGQGHEVTCLARGDSGRAPEGTTLVPADRTRADAYRAVAGTRWDLVVDVSRQPGQVRSALDVLADLATHWVFVSTGSVYADHSTPGAGVEAALLTALDGDVAQIEEYGQGKVACEEACRAARGDDVLIARSGLIVGRGDTSDRFGYWPGRFALAAQDGRPVLVPERLDRPAQFLDVADLAPWLVEAGTGGVTGVVDAYGPQRVLGDVLDLAADVAGFTGTRVEVSDQALHGAGVEEYMGRGTVGSLPLWLPDPAFAGFSARSTASADAAGLTARDLRETMHAALEWERELGLDRTDRKAGLDKSAECELVS